MSHAANRDRAGCQEFKERVHGERMSAEGEIYDDETSLLLMGDIYHIAAYREQKHKEAGGDPAKIPPLPEPLAMSKDGRKVELLRKAFKHLSRLRFHEMPDYELVRECITGFLPEKNEKPTDPFIRPIRWVQEPKSPELKRRHVGYPEWELFDKHDPVATDDFRDAENELQGEPKPRIDMTGRLPVKFQFRVAQMKQNSNHEGFPPHQILSDWMQVVSPLLYKDWDARKFEDGGHRTSTDGFRRARYLELLEDCLACARKHGSFRSREFFYHPADDKSVGSSANGNKKRRVVLHCVPEASKQAPMAFVSKVLYGLQNAITAEKAKKPPPPMRISFS